MLLPVVPVPEGVELELLLVLLLGDLDPELLEPPEPLVLAGGARGKIRLRKPRKQTTEKPTSRSLDLKAGSGGINVAMVGRVNELNGVTGSVLQGHVRNGETLRRVRPPKTIIASKYTVPPGRHQRILEWRKGR